MSLVAYAASSGDESDEDSEDTPQKTVASKADSHISDEDDFTPIEIVKPLRSSLHLPVPKVEHESGAVLPLLGKLPLPKASNELIEEEDDEFLHKKAVPLEKPEPKAPSTAKSAVRITIPSLKDFDDVEEKKEKISGAPVKPSGFSSLISILPQPKSEQSFAKAKVENESSHGNESVKRITLVPDSVKNRRPAQNTENVDRKAPKKHPPKPKPKPALVSVSDSEASDNEEDFFSLNTDDILPEVSADEIAAMVSKKAAEMAKSSAQFVPEADSLKQQQEAEEERQRADSAASSSHQKLDNEAIQALMGSQAKRRKMDDVQIIDISGEHVLPNKDEWLRTALASATTYQPTGVLTDDEPVAGTRRKHQITYLAHKAKANEAELQAMWSANRQNRRQTQSKYGF